MHRIRMRALRVTWTDWRGTPGWPREGTEDSPSRAGRDRSTPGSPKAGELNLDPRKEKEARGVGDDETGGGEEKTETPAESWWLLTCEAYDGSLTAVLSPFTSLSPLALSSTRSLSPRSP